MLLNFELEYSLNKITKKIDFNNNFKNDSFEIIFAQLNKVYYLNIIPKKTIVLKKLSVVTEYQFPKNCRIFTNGYQSWTDSYEHNTNQHTDKLSAFAKFLNPIFKFKQYGDYNFVNFKPKSGEFYGFATAYIKHNDKITLFKSYNENFAHTIFQFFIKKQQIKIFVDIEDVEINKKETLLNFEIKNLTFTDFIKSPTNNKKLSKTGWTSWYNYYQNINQEIILNNLNYFKNHFPPNSIFQIDDGYQSKVGDWLSINKYKFPNGLTEIVNKIHQNNYQAGLWLAPFAAQKNSKLAKNNPEWILKDKNNKPVWGGINWGGFYALDFYNQNFREYIKNVFDTILNKWDFDLVKLDFLYAVSIIPQHGKSRACVMHEAMEFLRKITGNKKILGCGVPLYQAFNKVDYCRIGTDISLDWNGKFYDKWLHRERVSTYRTLKNTIYRKFLDGKAFLNDPDVFLLRDENIKMNKDQKITVFLINAIFGSLIFTSDNFSKYTDWQIKLLKNLSFFSQAQILDYKEDNQLFYYRFSINNEEYSGISNLSNKIRKIDIENSYIIDIFTLEKSTINKKTINSFETKIFTNNRHY
ncbi:MAG: alpha-galactosidase [Bacteroidales bacterium]|nr:alpha-galactosidase [Bacteroidales bacterium]